MTAFLDGLCSGKPESSACPSLAALVSLLGTLPAVLWTTDGQARFTSLAAGGPVASESLQGKSVDEFFHGNNHGPLKAHAKALGGYTCSFSAEASGRDLKCYVQPLRAADGAVIGVLGIGLDLTEHVVTERALRISEHSYRSIIEEAPYAICRATVDGQLLQVNRAMVEMLGYNAASEQDLLMRDLPLIFADDGFGAFRRALAANDRIDRMEAKWVARDGSTLEVIVTAKAVLDLSGSLSHVDLMVEDVTEKKRMEEQLIQAQKMQAVGRLAGGIAHDFNNVLTVIGGHVEMLMRRTKEESLQEPLAQVQEATTRATRLTRQLLAFSRSQVLQPKVVNLNHLIHSLLAMLKRLIQENVRITFVPEPNLRCVCADTTQLEQVLINLIVNAQDAMPNGGEVTIETQNLRVDGPSGSPGQLAPGDYVKLVVHDTGLGIEPGVQAHIFEPFFTTKEVGKGTGLGLSMVYGVVEQTGGHIQVESRLGEGTSFTVLLPSVPERTVVTPPEATKAPPGGQETILLAEDEPGVRLLIEEYLQGLGYHILAAADGMDAIELAHANHETIRLLLSDVVMPRLSGFEVASEVKKFIPNVKVVFLSGYTGHEKTVSSLDVAATFLDKPLSLRVLASTVRDVLDT